MLIVNDVESSTIKAIAYDEDEKKLWLTFKSDAMYEYLNVEPAIVNELVDAESKGKYFAAHIKNKPEYAYSKVEQ